MCCLERATKFIDIKRSIFIANHKKLCSSAKEWYMINCSNGPHITASFIAFSKLCCISYAKLQKLLVIYSNWEMTSFNCSSNNFAFSSVLKITITLLPHLSPFGKAIE